MAQKTRVWVAVTGVCSALILVGLSIGQTLVGSKYIGHCPESPFIPIYLSAMGVGIILLYLNYCNFILFGVGITFYFFWFIAGSVCVYSLYQRDHRNCDPTLYSFAFWSTTFTIVLLFVIFLSSVCDKKEVDTPTWVEV